MHRFLMIGQSQAFRSSGGSIPAIAHPDASSVAGGATGDRGAWNADAPTAYHGMSVDLGRPAGEPARPGTGSLRLGAGNAPPGTNPERKQSEELN